MLQFATEHKVVVAELPGARLVEVGKEKLCLRDQRIPRVHPSPHRRSLRSEVQQFDIVNQLVSRERFPVEPRPKDLGEDDLLTEVVGLSNENAARLR